MGVEARTVPFVEPPPPEMVVQVGAVPGPPEVRAWPEVPDPLLKNNPLDMLILPEKVVVVADTVKICGFVEKVKN